MQDASFDCKRMNPMDLRERILRALYGSALVSAAALSTTACGDDASTDQSNRQTGNGWTLNHQQGDMSTSPQDMRSLPPQDMGRPPADMPPPIDAGPVDQGVPDQGPPDQGMPDQGPPPGCFDSAQSEAILPYEGWKEMAFEFNGKRVLVCDDTLGECATAEEMSHEERVKFLEVTLDAPSGCTGDPEVALAPDAFFCGPVPLSRAGCCYAVDIQFSFCAVGRPFTVDGQVRLAQVARRDGWCDPIELDGLDALPPSLREEIAAAWAESGTHEHASVASFGRFLMDLMSLGAPLDLVQATTRAIDDEIRHARDCFSVASAYAGMPLGPDTVDVSGSMDHAGDEAIILRDAILEGCIGETLAASVAAWMAPRSTFPRVATMLHGIAEDEGDHAVLAWRFVDWMLETRPHLIEVARSTFASVKVNLDGAWARGLDVLEHEALLHGRIRPATEESLRLRAYEQIVQPCAAALFEKFEGERSNLSA